MTDAAGGFRSYQTYSKKRRRLNGRISLVAARSYWGHDIGSYVQAERCISVEFWRWVE